MKNSSFHFFLLFLIVGFSALGYASYRTIDFNFPTNVASADISVTTGTIEPPVVVTAGPAVPESVVESQVVPTVTAASPVVPQQPVELSTEKKALVNALSQLVKDDIRMKIGSSGTRVGTVQKFINIYENKNSKVDNKYGEGFKKSIAAFQTAAGDEADGLADPGTYQKMIEWLKSN